MVYEQLINNKENRGLGTDEPRIELLNKWSAVRATPA